jgi:2-polyprenyl-3-methyl-5-hydroxy-6-metoxy-1,4-benzoquinol methylase
MATHGEYELVEHPLGFVEVSPKPSSQELTDYYRGQYYEKADSKTSQYSYEYDATERIYKQLGAQETYHLMGRGSGHVLELGYGEGFFIDYFAERGWDVSGVDFTEEGLMQYFPHLRERLAVEDVYAFTDAAIAADKRYDLVVTNNVVEHVREPLELLRAMRRMIKPDGIMRAVVPNDGSWLHRLLVERELGRDNFWVAPPAHLNYFTFDTFRIALEATGWEVVTMSSEFPIELFCLHPGSNYLQDRAQGRGSHMARVAFDVALAQEGIEKLTAFRQGCAAAGLGRNVVAYARPRS